VRTGVDSRSELEFTDQTLARLGANTLFSFSEGTRNLNLQDGAMLLRVPKGAGGAKINSSAVTAAITGTTVMVETHAVTKKNKNSYYNFIVLEGTARLYLPGRLGESTLVKAGQMIIMRADSKTIPEPVDVDIGKITQSSLLVIGFSTPLGSEALIAFEKTKQNEQKSSGQLYETNLMIYGGGTNVVLADPNTVDVAVSAESKAAQSPIPTPAPPDKFGAPSVIASSNPYVINSGTVITTDPSITTNGVMDYGKIYRGPTDDGAFSQWAFGSTSAFDTALNIDTEFFADPAHVPIAVFKFQDLALIGNPTVDTSNGGVTNVGLVGVDGITSGPPGGTLTFSGINLLALATVNGSINLTSDVSFQNLNILAIYARGATSDLTLNSSISNIGALKLAAGRSIQITNAVTLSVGGFDATTGGGNLIAQVGALSLDGEARFNAEVLPSATITNGANIILNVTNDLTNNSTTDLSRFRVTNEGHIGTGGNILVSIGGDYTSGDVEASIDNSNGGHIGTGANIILSTGGDLSANSLFVFLNNRNDGVIDSGGNVNVAIGGNLTTAGDVTIGTSARYDGSGGGTIGSDALVGLTANSVSAGGFFQSFISTNAGGSIAGNAENVVAVSGDLSANGGILIATYDTGFLSVNPTTFIAGGTIGGNASVLLTAQDILTTSTASGTPGLDIMALEASIYTNGSGSIGGNADVVVQAQQNIIAPGSSFFTVANGNFQGFGGGTIGGAALIDVGAVNFSTGSLTDDIYNYLGGRIGNNASINLALSGDLSVQGDALFRILNYGNSDGLEGGQIGENATISVTAASIQAAS
jgi:FecR protein